MLVPKHRLTDKEEAEKILERYGITLNELPQIKESDPALKDIDVNSGDVIEIERNSPIAGKSFYYRVVVQG